MPQFNNGTNLPKVEKGDIIMSGNPSEFSSILAENFFTSSYTYAQMNDLASGTNVTGINPSLTPSLIVGKKYLITNATDATINLIVEAIAVNKIHAEAKEPLFPHDVIYYDFTNDLIKFRLDTLNSVSAGQDWRNSVTLQIGTGTSFINLGSNVTGSIANGVTNIECGNDCVLEIKASSSNLKAGNGCNLKGRFNDVTCENNVRLNYDTTQSQTNAIYTNIYCGSNCDIYSKNLTDCNFYNSASIPEGGAVLAIASRNFYTSFNNASGANAVYTIGAFGNIYSDNSSDASFVYLNNGAFVITSAV
jgi:hypothetical protein